MEGSERNEGVAPQAELFATNVGGDPFLLGLAGGKAGVYLEWLAAHCSDIMLDVTAEAKGGIAMSDTPLWHTDYSYRLEEASGRLRLILDLKQLDPSENVLTEVRITTHPLPALHERFDEYMRMGMPGMIQTMMLECTKEVILKKPFLTVNSTSFQDQDLPLFDPRTGWGVTVNISARRTFEDPKNRTLILLSNFAVPILEQLREKACDSISPEERAKAKEMAQAGLKDFLEAREREREHWRLKPIPVSSIPKGDPLAYFIDESGDDGFKKGSAHYVVTLAEVPMDAVEAIHSETRNLVARLFPKTPDIELHFRTVDTYPDRLRLPIYEGCIQIVNRYPITFLAYVVYKHGYVFEKYRSEIAFNYATGKGPKAETPFFEQERLKQYPNELVSDVGGFIAVVLGSRTAHRNCKSTIFYDRIHLQSKNTLVANGFGDTKTILSQASKALYGVEGYVPDIELNFIDSKNYPMIWLCDFVSRELKKAFEHQLSRIDSIVSRFHQDGLVAYIDRDGRMTYYDLKSREIVGVLPD